MMYGIGDEKDYYIIDHFAKFVSKNNEQVAKQAIMEETCKKIAKQQKAITDDIEVLYAGLVGYFWEMRPQDYIVFKKIIKPFEDHLSYDGKNFLQTLEGVVNKNMKKGCPLLLKIVEEAILQQEETRKEADCYKVRVPVAYFMPECKTTRWVH